MKNKLVYFVLLTFVVGILGGCATGTGIQINTPVSVTPSGTQTADGQIEVPGFKLQINAPGVNPETNTPDSNGNIAGLLMGVWHGFISPATVVISFISPAVRMYEVHNDGSQYDLGFLLGVAIIFLVLGLFLGRRRRL